MSPGPRLTVVGAEVQRSWEQEIEFVDSWMEWELVSRSALDIVVVEYFVVDIVSVEDTVGSLKNLPDEGLRNLCITIGIR